MSPDEGHGKRHAMLAHTHTIGYLQLKSRKSAGRDHTRMPQVAHNASGRCDGDGEKDDEKKRGDRYGPRSESDESTGSLPGRSRLRGESCSRGRHAPR